MGQNSARLIQYRSFIMGMENGMMGIHKRGGISMKKVLSVLMVCFMIGSFLVGCGEKEKKNPSTENSSGDTSTSSKDDHKDPVKLIVWGGVPGESGPQDLVDAWNASHPEIQVEYVRFVNDDTGNTKLDTAILSGEQIDLFFTYGVDLMKKRVDSGMLENLDTDEVTAFIKDHIAGEGDGMVRIDGGLYAIPTVREPYGIMLNKGMLDEAGVTIPDNWTVEEFMDIAKQLTTEKDGKKVYGASIVIQGGLPLDISQAVLGGDHFYKASGDESNFDDETFKANAKLKELMDVGAAMPYEEVFSRKLDTYAHPAYLGSEIAMTHFSAWMLRYVKDLENYPHDFVTTFATFPTTEKGVANNYQAFLNNFICMNSKSAHKEEVMAFMKYWLTEGSKYMYKAGKMSVWKEADPEEATKAILGDNAEQLFDVEAYKKVMFNPDSQYIIDTITVAYPQLLEVYKEESEMYFLNNTTLEEYLSNTKKRADQEIKKALK